MATHIIEKFIGIQLAIKNIRRDKVEFEPMKFNYLYQDMLDSALERLEKDFYDIKSELISNHQIEVKYLDKNERLVRYMVKCKNDNKIIEFSPIDLKELTSNVMKEYLNGEIKWKTHVWKVE